MVPFFIASFAIVVAWAVSTVLTKLQWNVPWWVDAPSTMGFYGLFYAFFRKALWRWKPLHWAGVVRVPDLSGTWRGTLKTSFDDRAQVHDVTAQIQQDWTQMLIVFKGKYSTSKSVTGSIFVEDIPVLRYEYFNEPNPGA